MPLTQEQLDLIASWNHAACQLTYWKQKEAELRKEIVAKLTDPSKESGTEHVEIAKGWRLTVLKSLDYKLANPDGNLKTTLDLNGIAFVARWKPELSLTEYNKLKPEHKSVLTPFLTIKPSFPQVKLVPPAEPK